MALTATLHRFEIALSDSDRGVYEALDLRVARHPSETVRYLLTRVLSYCLFYEEGLSFSKGLSTTEEPAVWLCEPGGRVRVWIDIGRPSAERLHKASKAADRVVVCTTDDPEVLRRATRGERIHHAEQIEIVTFDKELLDSLEPLIQRNVQLDVVHSGGRMYVTAVGRTFEGDVRRASLS